MSLELRALPEPESPHVQQFLDGIFHPSEDAVFLSAAQMHWKYWETHPDWTGPRSYGFGDDSGNLLAFACAWPFTLRTMDGIISGVHPIDWAASPKARGAGAQLLKQVRVLRDICCCTGGTDIAQVVVRQSGFKPSAAMRMLARPLRPLRQALTLERRNWKVPAKLIRNALWAMSGAAVPAGWTAEPVSPEGIPESVLPTPAPERAVASRSTTLFDYILKCPTARYQLFLLRQDGKPCGYFLLSFVPGQARVADAWVIAGADGWRALYALAIQAALKNDGAAEITTGATFSEALDGSLACGFRSYGECTVMLYDPQQKLASVKHIHLQMLDNDSSFLHNNRIEYASF
jgi:hypothetical protein